MNRIRQYNGIFQVLITPTIQFSPDSSLMLGNWEDEDLRNFHIVDFPTLNEAQCEAFKYPDIDWHRIVLNHTHIYQRLRGLIDKIIADNEFNVEFIPTLMSPEKFKNSVFDRVMNGGERYNLRYGMTDIISFTIVNPWFSNLKALSNKIAFHREHYVRNDMRIKYQNVVDDKMIVLYGSTELGSIFEIRLIPTIIHQWVDWYAKTGFHNQEAADKVYVQLLKQQEALDNGPVLR